MSSFFSAADSTWFFRGGYYLLHPQLKTLTNAALKKEFQSLKTKLFFLSLILFSISFIAGAQSTEVNFVNFNSKDGLSSNNVNAIIKDRQGYMWFATDDGLNRFDGMNFKVYRNNALDSTSIGGNKISSICEDEAGNLWIGTNQSLSLYDQKRDVFVNYYLVKSSPVRAVCVDRTGNIWMGSYAGLYMFNPKTGRCKNYTATVGKLGHLQSNRVVSLFEDSRHRLWIGTSAGLHLYVKETDSFIVYQHSEEDPISLAGNSIRCITEDIYGTIWLGTDGGVSRLLSNGKSFTNYNYRNNDDNTLSSDKIWAVQPDVRGTLWIGTEEGLNVMDGVSGRVERVKDDVRNKYHFVGKRVRSIFIDKSGIFWFGTVNSGINKYDKNLAFFNLRQSNPLDVHGLSSPIVTSFAEAPSGDIYIGTDGGGLNLYHLKNGLFDRIKLSEDERSGLSVVAIEKAGDELWVGTYQKGIYVLNIKTGQIRHFEKGESSAHLSSNEIFCIKKDSEGNIWIGTNGEGVNVYNPKEKVFYKYNRNRSAKNERLLLNGYIRSIAEDSSGNMWIGSQGTGIALFNPVLKTFQVINPTDINLLSNHVQTIHVARDGTVWVGTAGGGLCVFEKENRKFISYNEKDGLSNAVIYKILEDDQGRIWVSTNSGISSFDRTTKRFKNYSFQNGIQRTSFSIGAGIKTSKGVMFFGGLDGFNYFTLPALDVRQNAPLLTFTDLKIANRNVIAGKNSPIEEHISVAKQIRLDFKQNFSIDFVALNYTSPQDTRYFYKLEGFDKDWNDIGLAHSAVYTNLDPGNYMFRVIAKSNDDQWSTQEKTIKIYVKPPLWRSIYAYVLYFGLIISLIAFIRYRSITKLKNRFAREQERKEAEQQHEFDQLKIKFLTNLSHEFRTPISLITGPVERMMKQELDKGHKEQLNLIQRNAQRLLNLVNQLLDFRKLEQNELQLNLSDGDIISFIKDVSDSFKDLSEQRHIIFSFSSSVENLYTSFDRDKVERILFNLLSNAFKFTNEGGKINLIVEERTDSKLEITVSDTGIGMSEAVRQKIFDRFYQGNVHASILNQGSGIGLSIAKEFVRMHGGTVEVQTEQGKGSRFVISLPYKPILKSREHYTTIKELPGISNEQVPEREVPGPEKHTVLIIEDNDDFRIYLRENLKSFYKIVEASNGKDGWQKALSTHPKIIVSDISMPVMDGIVLSRKLKSDKRTNHIPIILLTAMNGDANQLQGLRTGASDYLTKPFNFEILDVKIKNLIDLNKSLKETYTRQLNIRTTEVEVESEDEKLLYKITRYIESKIDNPDLSVQDLSNYVFMNRRTLYNKIITLTGETPVEFIRSVKLTKAAALLESGNMRISEVGYAVGFGTPNYFTRAFKAKFNISPSEYLILKKQKKESTSDPQ
jgi:signal transduction histidine kinase/ligand-binding sensor domain-containing protein/DNA-binding response OmpR family regulator